MAAFFSIYLGLAALLITASFFLAYFGAQKNQFKSILLVLYILAIFGVFFASGVLEVKYQWNRLYSTGVAVALLGALYLADNGGTRLGKNKMQ